MVADCTLQLKYPFILKAWHFLFPLGHAQFRCTVPTLCACHPQLVEVPNGHCWFCSATAQITDTRPLLTLPQARTCIYKPCCVLYFHTHQGNTSRFFPNENILQKPCLVHLQPCHRVSTHTCCAVPFAAMHHCSKRRPANLTPSKHTGFLGTSLEHWVIAKHVMVLWYNLIPEPQGASSADVMYWYKSQQRSAWPEIYHRWDGFSSSGVKYRASWF